MSADVFVYREPTLIVQDIIQEGMDLTDGQVMCTNQKYFIPTDGIFIVVSYVGPSRVISSVNEYADNEESEFTETQSLTMLHLLQIDVMSYGDEARTRKEEIIFAVHSLFSEMMQEQFNMQIARQPGPFLDTSFLEETKRITRYTTTLVTTSVNRKIKPVGDYYTDFSRAVPPELVTNA